MIDTEQLRRRYKLAAMVTTAMISGCVIFGGIIFWLIKNSNAPLASAENNLLHPAVLWLAGIVGLTGSFVIKNILLKKSDATTSIQKIDTLALADRLQTALLVSLAMVEGVILFGCVIALQSRDPNNLLMPLIVGAIGFSLHFPNYEKWKEWAQDQ